MSNLDTNGTTGKTEVISIDHEVKIFGLSLRKSSLPLSFKSLGKLWNIYAADDRYNVTNQITPITEYGIALNKIPDYLTGCAVSDMPDEDDKFSSFVLPRGKYIKDTFSAGSFHELTTTAMQSRNVKKWAKDNKLTINDEFTVEVYPANAIEGEVIEMYTLTPIKE